MKKFFSKEVKIGITVLISLGVLFWGIEYLKGVNLFKPANFYYVEFKNVAGLTDSAPVTINGFQIGQVRELNYDYNSGAVVVLLGLEKDLQIPVGTKAVLATDLLGTAQIELKMARNATTFHKVGDKLPGENAVGLMDEVGNELLPSVANLMPKIDSILTNLNAVVGNPALQQSVNRLNSITANLEAGSSQLSRTLPAIMKNVENITVNLDSISGNLSALSSELGEMPLDSVMSGIQTTTNNLSALTSKLNSTESSLGLLLNDRSLYEHIDGAVTSLDSLFIDIKKNPKRYVTIKVF